MIRMARTMSWLALLAVLLCPALARAGGKGGVDLRFRLNTQAQDRPVTVTVSGRVLDRETGQPIPGALVRGHITVQTRPAPEMFVFSPYRETRADAQGRYQLTFESLRLASSGPEANHQHLCVDAGAPGYGTHVEYAREKVSPRKLRHDDFDFRLTRGLRLAGVAVDDAGQPLTEAQVALQNNWNGDWMHFKSLGVTQTDAQGRFEIFASTDPKVTETEYGWLQISKPGHGVGFFPNLNKMKNESRFVVPKGGVVRGRVVDAAGHPVAGCEVRAARWPVGLMAGVRTDRDGRYELAGLPGEASLKKFFLWKNKSVDRDKVTLDLYARPNPADPLAECPSINLVAQDGQAVDAPDMIVGQQSMVRGRLIPSKSTYPLQGLLVRLDGDWKRMAKADGAGNFELRNVTPGRHKLTVYLPTNLRYDRGIGRVEIEVNPGQELEGAPIQLEEMTEVRVQILDAQGNPLEGVTAGATWSENGQGGWTEGYASNADGWALLYLHPGQRQYVAGFDRNSAERLVTEMAIPVEPQAGQVIDNVRVTMLKPASLFAQARGEKGEPLANQRLGVKLVYANGIERRTRVQTSKAGEFKLEGLTPGVIRAAIECNALYCAARLDGPMELKPGQKKVIEPIQMVAIKTYPVSGRLKASPTFSNLKGFKIRVGLEQWQPMIETDAQGNFTLPRVRPGKHRLTAYLPYNERTNRGVGHVMVEVKDGAVSGVELPLETLATLHMRIQDEAGKPLENIAAAAWWTKDHSGVFTEGTRSDKQGRATLYLYPDDPQFIGAHDWDRKYTLKGDTPMTLKPGQTVEGHVVTMTAADK